jgi:uncharacterized membrane protein YdjX (TVP38/TMEM64 family)
VSRPVRSVLKCYAAAAGAICLLMLALFALAHLLAVPVLSEESPSLGEAGLGAAAVSFGLLAGDVVLPVPSSAVMIANGALFGPLGGAVLSLAGSEAAALLAYAIGRRGDALLDRFVPPGDRAHVASALERGGTVAIVVTRPVPVIAETTAILAGAVGMPLARFAWAAALGSLPPALAYALAGALAARTGTTIVVFGGVLVLATLVWLGGRRRAAAMSTAPARTSA